jgi:hypothetical protein
VVVSPRWLGLLALGACGGDGAGDTTSGIDPAEEACYHIAEGSTVDGGATPDDAPVLTPGFEPYRVVLIPDAPTYVAFDTGPGTLVLSADVVDGIADVQGAEVSQLGPNPTCEQDLGTLVEASVSGGLAVVELNDHYKATMWLLGALR